MMTQHLIAAADTVTEALRRLNSLSGRNMTLFVIDPDGSLCGSLTDGDIRRALLRSDITLQSQAAEICHTHCHRLLEGEDGTARYERVKRALRAGVQLLPVVNESGRLLHLIDLQHRSAMIPADAVLMAGGMGERLRPLTLETPKPLLPVRGRAIIDYNIDLLRRAGVRNISVTVNYLKDKIIEHFAAESLPEGDPRVQCVAEPCRLGTMGSVALVPGLTHDDIIVMNSDLLTDIDFERMWLHHRQSGAALTMATTAYTVAVPYAIVNSQDGYVKSLDEKPTYNYAANAGVYMMQRSVLKRITPGEYLDAPTLIEMLIADGEKVSSFPIEGMWIDIGSPDDYRRANS